MNPEEIWKEYKVGKQTYLQLSKKYNCSSRTIQRKIDLNKPMVLMHQLIRTLIIANFIFQL